MKTDTDSQFINTIIHWLYHFTNDIETEPQMKDSYEKLQQFVLQAEADTNLTKALVTYTAQFLRESFQPLLRLLCQCYYQDVFCGDVNANCFVESDNASLKKDSMKPNANSKLYVSCKNICDHTKRRIDALKRNAAKNTRTQLLPKPSDNDIDKIRRDLSKHIVEDKREKVLQQYGMSPGMLLHVCMLLSFTCHLQYDMCLSIMQTIQSIHSIFMNKGRQICCAWCVKPMLLLHL